MITRHHSLRAMLLATSGMAALAATHPAAAAATAAAKEAEPDTIVVTAQRREERLPDVPVTILSIDATQLDDANVKSLADVANISTGLRFDKKGAYTQTTIRGVGSALGGVGVGSNIGIYLDGFYLSSLVGVDFDLMNIQDIQVLKGPQGTLFGRNTTAGAILVQTKKPSTTTRAIVEAQYSMYGAQKYSGYVTTGLGEKVAVDFAGSYNKGDGWFTNIYDGNKNVGKYERWSVRTGINVDITDRLSVLLRYEHASVNDPTPLLTNLWFDPTYGHAMGVAALRPGVVITSKPGEVAYSIPLELQSTQDALRMTVNWDLDFATLTSYTQLERTDTPVYTNDYAQSSAKITSLKIPAHSKTKSEELILASKPGSRLQYTAGLFYYANPDAFPATLLSFNGSAYNFSSGSGVESKSTAAFADVTYEVIDRLFLTGGIRYTHDKLEQPYYLNAARVPQYLPELTTNKFTPRAVVRYALTPDSNVYASYSQGFKAQIYNLTVSAIPVKPEELNAYEVGYKYATRAFSLNVSGFYYDYTNEQVASYPVINGTPSSVTFNAAASTIYGIDADTRFNVTDDFSLTLGAEYLHARWDDFTSAPGFTVNPTTYAMPNGPVNASGKHMLRSPSLTATAGGRYGTVVAGGELVLSANVYFSSSFYFDTNEQLPQGSYATLGLRAEWTDPSDRYVLAVFGNNVTNARYLTQLAQTGNAVAATWSPPAIVGGSIRVKF